MAVTYSIAESATPDQGTLGGSGTPLAPQLDGIPQELQDRAQWVVHRGGAPYAARHTGHRNGRAWGRGIKVGCTDPAKLATFDETWDLYLAGGWEGIGYSILPTDGYVLIDIDHCLRADGTLPPIVSYWVERVGGYVERSPGGDGVHVLVRARLPRAGSHYQLHDETLHERFKVEVYEQERYVRLTGVPLPGRGLGAIADRQAELDAFIAAMTPERAKARSNGQAQPELGGMPARISPPMSDAEVLQRARTGRYAATFSALYDHGTSDNLAWIKDDSASGKDHFLVSELCYWTQDADQSARLMRASALERPKYDEYHHGRNNLSYLDTLIAECLAKKERHYGDGLGAATPSPNGHHAAGEGVVTADPPPDAAPLDPEEAQRRETQAYRQLSHNGYLSAPERRVLPALIALAGYRMGQRLPGRIHIGFIKPAMRKASGICARDWEAALPRLTDRGLVTRMRHPSENNPGGRWYDYTLIGAVLNDGGLETVGQQRKQGRPVAAKKRPPVRRAASAALDTAERQELDELRAWKRRYECCWLCRQPLSGNDHAHAHCQRSLAAVPGQHRSA